MAFSAIVTHKMRILIIIFLSIKISITLHYFTHRKYAANLINLEPPRKLFYFIAVIHRGTHDESRTRVIHASVHTYI